MSRIKNVALLIVLSLLMFLLTSCLYPDEQRANHRLSAEDSVMLVQSAVDRYQADRTLLPIKNFEMNTPLYERYQIDLSQLIKLQYLSSIPVQAFENGGSSIFVLVDAEDDPTVKLMDIVTIQTTGEIEEAVREFMQKNNGQVPAKKADTNGWYPLDLTAIKQEKKTLKSVFSGENTSWLVDVNGQVVVDYSLDLMMLIDREQLADELTADLDLRSVLVDHAFYVPVKSAPYYWDGDAPVISSAQ